MFPFHNISSLSSIVRLHPFQFTLFKYIISVPKCKKKTQSNRLKLRKITLQNKFTQWLVKGVTEPNV